MPISAVLLDIGGTLWPDRWPSREADDAARLERLRATLPLLSDDRARDLLTELPLRALATTEFPLADAASAYAAIDRGDRGVLHAALRYE